MSKRIIISHCDWIDADVAIEIAVRVRNACKTINSAVIIEGGKIPDGFRVVAYQTLTNTGALKIQLEQREKQG